MFWMPRTCRSPITEFLFLRSSGSQVPQTSLLICIQAGLVFLRSEANGRTLRPSKALLTHTPRPTLARTCTRTRTCTSLTVCIPLTAWMCIQRVSGPYPCGHSRTDWTYCAAAKRKARFNLKPATHAKPCKNRQVESVAADLEESCASTCLTKAFVCCQCPVPKPRVGWVCRGCEHVRCHQCRVWAPCQCPCGTCGNLALGKGGATCDDCLRACA